jgi:hypothetical protein
LHDPGQNFGYVSSHYIPEVQKIIIIFFLPEQLEIINSIGNPYQTKVKYTNTFYQSEYMQPSGLWPVQLEWPLGQESAHWASIPFSFMIFV